MRLYYPLALPILSGAFRRGQHVRANLVCEPGLTDAQMQTVLGWFSKAAEVIQAHGLTT